MVDKEEVIARTEAETARLKERLAKHRAKKASYKERQLTEEQRKRKEQEQKRKEAARQELARRELAKNHLIPFILRFKPNYQVGWVHKVFAAELERFFHDVEAGEQPRLMVFVPPRHGKELVHSTPVLTPSGWTTHGELRPGDYVYHPSGKPVKVLAESPPTQSDIEVEFSNGQKIVAHAHHEWLVHDRRTHGAQQRIIETQDMLAEHWIGEKGVRGGRSRWQLPDVKPIRFDWKELPMDPYALGVWLGDGTTGAPNITNSEEDAVVFREAFEEAGFKCSGVYIHPEYGTHRSYFGKSGLTKMLYKTGVFEIKQVPEVYLRGSKEQRMQLLAGLIDTDGHVEPHTGRCRFVTTTPALKDAVFDLATTLGFRPYVRSTPATTSSSGIKGNHEVFTVGFQPTLDLPTRIPRKQVLKEAMRRKVSVVNVRRVQPRPGKCIQVDSPDGMYVVGEQLIPTHNSEIISNNFPSWVLGRRPDWEIIMASYTVNLPLRFSKANRARIKDKSYRAVFPDTELDRDSTSAEEWLTTKRGGLKCAGVGGGLSGFGANILIIDDPIKDYEDAQSKTILETVKNWYNTVAETRLAPDGGVIIVQTRWSDDDLSGWQLRTDKENKEAGHEDEILQNWRVVSFPAIAEVDEYIDPNTLDFFEAPAPGRALIRRQGEPLHPDRYSLNYLMRKKINMPSNQWNALFQQNPVPASGDFFREEDFMYYDSVPVLHDCPVVFAWDLAIGEKRNNDYTVGFAGAVIPQQGVNTLYILDMYRNRVRDLQQLEAIVSMYAKYKHNAYRLGVEQGTIWLAIEKRLKAMFEERNLVPVFDETLAPVRDKRVRATPLQGWMQNHRVYFPRHQPWVSKAREELLRFDAGVNDDVVDALAWMVRMVQNMAVVEDPLAKKRAGKTVKEMLADYARGQRDSGRGYMAA